MNMKYVWLNIRAHRPPARTRALARIALIALLLIGFTLIWTRFSHRVGATSPYWQAVMSEEVGDR